MVIRVDSIVAWTKPRPRAEFASAEDRVVILTVIHVDGPKPRPGKRVVATKAKLVQPIVRSFNQRLRLSAPAYSYECGPGEYRLSYRVAFARSPDAPPDVVASMGPCFGVGATAGKRALPALRPTGAFVESVAHLLGSSELHWHVAASKPEPRFSGHVVSASFSLATKPERRDHASGEGVLVGLETPG